MNGVVLWSDPAAGKAVVWCEDQGDLAYYQTGSGEEAVALDVGDWIIFDLETRRQQRLVRNPRRVGQGGSRELQGLLQDAAQDADAPADQQAAEAGNCRPARVIPFAPVRRPRVDGPHVVNARRA
ncbi:hypothetical protein SAMN05444007_101313 [Cribrihabitans marinus]|uniref:Uncharacterized protein n=1 Tax=Cribrihabitans marinus TaxID=1227549 RepID=A0A1H6QVY9_9RHOB|nr:hypothetical protein [Cribrihabitans marinus]GGH19957.1 hypothetical protein GCM10010973_03590 [Cribrihabitans marinus]SEI47713.1 hypothetical protein SAMN05444007_101313 [Cribrihabitans marinus]